MTSEDIQTYVDELLTQIKETTDTKVTREELEQQITKFLEYGVPIDHAKQTLLKKYGNPTTPQTPNQRTLIIDLQPNQTNITLLSKIININQREITTKGETKTIYYGILADESGTIPFTAWKDFNLEKGDVLDITNAYLREWQGDIRINLGDRTNINKTDATKLQDTTIEPREYKIKDLRPGLGAIELTARILDTQKRDVTINDETKQVISGTLADDTGKAQYSAWHDFKLKNGDVIKITGGYVKTWKGIPQITIDENVTVEKQPANTITPKDITTHTYQLHELIDKRGALDIQTTGTIIEIKPGSGLINRCPTCNRVLQNTTCTLHGDVQPKPDLRLKLIIDDGTGSITAILDRNVTEKLLGQTLQDLQQQTKQHDNQTLLNTITKQFFSHQIQLQGNALGDEFGTTIIAQNATLNDLNITQQTEKIIQELEDL